MDINGRINKIISELKVDQKTFAASISITPQGLSKIVKGYSKPSFEILSHIVLTYPNLNAKWLLTGQEDIWLIKSSKKEGVSDTERVTDEEVIAKSNLDNKTNSKMPYPGELANELIPILIQTIKSKEKIIEELEIRLQQVIKPQNNT